MNAVDFVTVMTRLGACLNCRLFMHSSRFGGREIGTQRTGGVCSSRITSSTKPAMILILVAMVYARRTDNFQ